MSESEIQQRIQIEAPAHGCVLLRNNSGAFKDSTGRMVRFGLGNVSSKQGIKSSDLIGFRRVTITPDMVGKTVAIFTAIEVKREDWKPAHDPRTKAQANFLQWILANGGIAGFANSIESFRRVLGLM